MSDIIHVQFERRDAPNTYGGREYTYYSDHPLQVGDVVTVSTKYGINRVRVTKTNLELYHVDPKIRAMLRHIDAVADPVATKAAREADREKEQPIQTTLAGLA